MYFCYALKHVIFMEYLSPKGIYSMNYRNYFLKFYIIAGILYNPELNIDCL